MAKTKKQPTFDEVMSTLGNERFDVSPAGEGANRAAGARRVSKYGVGAEVAARVVEEAFDWLDAPPARVHQEDVPMPYAANLEALSLPSVEKIVKAAKAVCYR